MPIWKSPVIKNWIELPEPVTVPLDDNREPQPVFEPLKVPKLIHY